VIFGAIFKAKRGSNNCEILLHDFKTYFEAMFFVVNIFFE
jgi:hypothetical protein